MKNKLITAAVMAIFLVYNAAILFVPVDQGCTKTSLTTYTNILLCVFLVIACIWHRGTMKKVKADLNFSNALLQEHNAIRESRAFEGDLRRELLDVRETLDQVNRNTAL